jgi:hypothetical protein
MNTRRVALGAVLATAIVAVGCSSASPGDKASSDTGAKPAPTSTPAAAKAGRPAAFTKADVKLAVKTTKKDCYGSVGCNVEYTVTPSVDKAKLSASGHAWLVTYEVSGVEDGPAVNSFTLQTDGSYAGYEVQGFGSTASKSAKLVAKVTEIEAA